MMAIFVLHVSMVVILQICLITSGDPCAYYITGLILGLHLANERRRYKVMASLIAWAQT